MTSSPDLAPFAAVATAMGVAKAEAIPAGSVKLSGELLVPRGAGGLVLFAHGSDSRDASRRNRFVAERLRERGLGTLRFDPLTPEERRVPDDRYRFDVGLLARRLAQVTDWVGAQPFARSLAIGYFGSGVGAAAAIVAAVARPRTVKALVSCGGRPALAGGALRRTRAPLLLLVGSEDPTTLEANELALTSSGVFARLELVPGATHRFEEPGAMETVAELAGAWFNAHLTPLTSNQAPHTSA